MPAEIRNRSYTERIIILLKMMDLSVSSDKIPCFRKYPAGELLIVAATAYAKGYITKARFAEEIGRCDIASPQDPMVWAHYLRNVKEWKESETK